jgi:hypothetical protein
MEAVNEHLEVIGSQDGDRFFLSGFVWHPEPIDHCEPFVGRFGLAPGCEEEQQTY